VLWWHGNVNPRRAVAFTVMVRRLFRTAFLLGLVAMLFKGHLLPPRSDREVIEAFTRGKEVWKHTYLATGSIDEATKMATLATPRNIFPTEFPIYPHPLANNLQWKLDELQRRHLNLFLDAPVGGVPSGSTAQSQPTH
jgi:hypothetical protein